MGFDVDRLEISIAINSYLYASAKFKGVHSVRDYIPKFEQEPVDPKTEVKKVKDFFLSTKERLRG